ncbi:MAG: glycosyltransferase family 2 protein, partial [Verrucomicrobiota bacterium]|nr:glycosyltransferase family 2 protein [Verrucomicrobiota bacterium]
RALSHSWQHSKADVVSYMDVDLSTDLEFFPQIINPVLQKECDLCIGSRLLRPEWTRRGLKREVISRGYNLLLQGWFQAQFKDAQCGFKAISRCACDSLVPRIQDCHWFFDTELLLLAQHESFKIKEIPVKWVDDQDSRVKILKTAIEDLRGCYRLWKEFRKRDRGNKTLRNATRRILANAIL